VVTRALAIDGGPLPSDRPGTAGAAGRWQAVVQRPGRAPGGCAANPDEKE
jgi:hypothetical protein